MVGMLFDGVGGLYLAYDLLGGENNALSTLTRVVNYSLLLGIAYGVPLGLQFGLIAGLGAGTALALQLGRISKGQSDKDWGFAICISLLRGLGFGGGLACLSYSPQLGWAALILATLLSLTLTKFGATPLTLYEAGEKPHFTGKRLLFGLFIGAVTMAFAAGGAYLCGRHDLIPQAAKIGASVGFATSLVTSMSPVIEYYSENMPDKSLGIVGAVMIVIGFGIQIIPNLASFLDLPY